jgi:nucleoside-diphosphate-sugar epimerase/putative sterol carrier protein
VEAALRVVVTGGSGQLGTQVLARLSQSRKVKSVLSLDVRPPMVPGPKVQWRIADVRDPGIGTHLAGADALVHLAFIVTRPASAEEMRAVNVEGTQRVVTAAVAAGVQTLVYSSSVGAYGLFPDLPDPIVEDTLRRPTPGLTYAENKWQVEAWLDELEPAHPELRIVRLRPVILLGARIEHAMGRSLRRRIVPGLDATPLPVVWDGDVADAVLLALLGDRRGAYNLAADQPLDAEAFARAGGMRFVSVPRGALRAAEVAGGIAQRLGHRPPFDAGWLRAAGVRLNVSSERARRELGWRPSCPTAADVARRLAAETPGRMDPRIRLFFAAARRLLERVPPDLQGEAAHMTLSVHLEFTGPGGGDFALYVDRGRPRLERGVPRPPDTAVSLSARTFLDLLAGKTDVATAQFSGRVRTRGEPSGGYVLGAMVTMFRNATRAPGRRGWVARRVAGWFERGAQP